MAYPLLLTLLIPWAVLAAWVWRRTARRVTVPFTRLWGKGDASATASTLRRIAVPPRFALLLLTAGLNTILLAAGPLARPPVPVVVIDTGGLMASDPRRAAAAERLRDVLADRQIRQVRTITLPADPPRGRSLELALLPVELAFSSATRSPSATFVDTRAALRATLDTLRRDLPGVPIVAITDHPVPPDVGRVSGGPFVNVGMDAFAVRTDVHGVSAATVTVRAFSETLDILENRGMPGGVWVSIGDSDERVSVPLPRPDADGRAIVDVDASRLLQVRRLTARLHDAHGGPLRDDVPEDDVAHVVRRDVWPALRIGSAGLPALGSAAALLNERYAAVADPDATPLLLTSDPSDLDEGPAVVFASTDDVRPRDAFATVLRDHPLLRRIAPPPGGAGGTPGNAWEAVVSTASGRGVVYVRDRPTRAVYATAGPRTPTADGIAWADDPSFATFLLEAIRWTLGREDVVGDPFLPEWDVGPFDAEGSPDVSVARRIGPSLHGTSSPVVWTPAVGGLTFDRRVPPPATVAGLATLTLLLLCAGLTLAGRRA